MEVAWRDGGRPPKAAVAVDKPRALLLDQPVQFDMQDINS